MPSGVYTRSDETKQKLAAFLATLPRQRGHKLSAEHRAKLSAAKKGKPPHNKGKSVSEEHRAKMRLAMLEVWARPGMKARFSQAHIGKPAPQETRDAASKMLRERWSDPSYRKDMILRFSGERSCKWKGGITPERVKIRSSVEYKQWRKAVFARDNFTCRACGVRGGTLNADHIKPFAFFPELRFDLANGQTLCTPCHRATDTYGGKALKHG